MHSHTQTLIQTLIQILKLTLTNSQTHILKYSHKLSHTNTHTQSHTHSHTHTCTHTHTHTHIHSHTLSLFFGVLKVFLSVLQCSAPRESVFDDLVTVGPCEAQQQPCVKTHSISVTLSLRNPFGSLIQGKRRTFLYFHF